MRRRAEIIEGTAAHLRTQDPGGITLEDIRAVTRTSNSQIFHYFPGGKEELFLEVARYEADLVIEDQQPYLSALDTWADWERWRETVLARYRAQGQQCPLGSLMSQLAETPGAPEVISALIGRWQAEVERGIRTMQASGLIRAAIDPVRCAAAMIAGIQGGVLVLRSTGDLAHLEASIEILFDHLRG
ncbi:TetR/AcrR family transcriptional regulator [Nocardioides sp. NPDC023903]|uniref:TetR/AcrR family transcriptional regulator n=1 Tax=Nocardioides sp. NPDC023903 TaxID=3157195 RepID=UPI003401FDF2